MEIIISRRTREIWGRLLVGTTENYYPLRDPNDYNWFLKQANKKGDITSRWMTEEEEYDLT